jgi:hypothetical protein
MGRQATANSTAVKPMGKPAVAGSCQATVSTAHSPAAQGTRTAFKD